MSATMEKSSNQSGNGGGDVVLVDSEGRSIGTAPKLEAHQNGGRLHLALSVLVFDSKGRLLIQQRALGKYHCGGRWANTCCSHPSPGESIEHAAHRRLKAEMGFDVPLREAFEFIYEVGVGNGMTEHEYDHVLVGRFEGTPSPDPSEVMHYKWVTLPDLFRTVSIDSKEFAPWFKIILVLLAEMDTTELLSP